MRVRASRDDLYETTQQGSNGCMGPWPASALAFPVCQLRLTNKRCNGHRRAFRAAGPPTQVKEICDWPTLSLLACLCLHKAAAQDPCACLHLLSRQAASRASA